MSALLARAAAWLVEPADAATAPAPPPPAVAVSRPVLAVCGIAPGVGATTLARALAAALAGRDPLRSAVVAGADPRGALPLGTPAAARLARIVGQRAGVPARASGRLCLALADDAAALAAALRDTAALVADGDPHLPVATADRVVLVAGPRTEPSLAEIVAASLGGDGARPLIALNRADPEWPGRWGGRADLTVPASPAAARLALSCRGAGGAFGAAIDALAERCLAP